MKSLRQTKPFTTGRALVAGFAVLWGTVGDLCAAALVDVGRQPDGGLSRKIVYLHGGHGYAGGGYERPNLLGMIEDLGNQDQMTFFADYLFRAGATVVPLRPIGHQANEVVLDNDDPGVSYFGNWSDSSATVFYGSAGDVPYRSATTSATETAYARYQPTISEAGFYPVYAWSSSGGNRASDQLYRVHHSGGTTEVTVNHREVGNGLVYLGTYYFDSGNAGYVDVSNRSSEPGRAVVADMIRFGNGMGVTGGGRTREDENSLSWIDWHVDRSQGISPSEYGTSNVSAPPKYAEYMNREAEGPLSDRVFVSFHSNAAGGTARGVVGLHNTTNGGATPNQVLLARSLAQEVNDDLVAQNGQFEHAWYDRGSSLLYEASFNYGEINNFVINNEFDATILEVAFHDNQLDAELLRDPKVRDAIARASYQGLVKYFRAVEGNSTPATILPSPVTGMHVESNALGNVTISWTPPAANSHAGDAASGYKIYASVNGYGFDGGTFVAGGGVTAATLAGYDSSLPHYFKVVAVNAGGESLGSEVVAVLPGGGVKQVLIVNGFDRLDRNVDPKQPGLSPPVDRVRPRERNFETISTAAGRTAVMGRVLDYCGVVAIPEPSSAALSDVAAVSGSTAARKTSLPCQRKQHRRAKRRNDPDHRQFRLHGWRRSVGAVFP